MEPMENIRIVLAENIKALRKKRGKISQDALAERAGLSIGMIKQVELGNRWPSPATTEAIAKGLGVTISELFESQTKETPKEMILPLSSIIKKVLAVPDDIYEMAQGFKHDDEVWENVRAAFDHAIEKKERLKQTKKA